MESDHPEDTDSSSEEFEDHINISLLPDKNRHRKKRFRGPHFVLKLRDMFGGKTAIYGVVTALLLLSVLLLAVFARPSSSYETVNKDSSKNPRHDFQLVRDASVFKNEVNDQEAQSLRLPRHVSPIEYLVYLHPNLKTFKFSGKVDVLLYCNEAANYITLHVGKKIKYYNVAVAEIQDIDNREKLVKLEVKKTSRQGEMISIALGSELQKGEYYFLKIEFNSELSRGLAGFYLSSYKSPSGETRYLATTHFEATDARNAFPCFDEPNMKAKFSIVIKREKRHVALANMPLERTDGCKNDFELCTDHFQKSVKMSTYLVAFVVSDYQSITNKTARGVKVSVWAPPEQIEQGRFALEVGVKVLEYYEKIFKVDYPLPKQDLIAIPDFSAGAMENWGLITYRLTSLLYDKNKSSDSNKQWVAVVVAHELAHQVCLSNLVAIPDFPTGAMENWGLITFRLTSILYDATKSSQTNKQWVAVVVAHELAHQWFGNLVTMDWWNDLWLNEGFASFMENVGVNHVHPEWKMMDQFFLDKFEVSTSMDQLSHSHPIMAVVKDPAQINSLFDSISYDKGAAIIRMLEDVLGKKTFFKGLQSYLQKYKFSNAETNDLWKCLTDAQIEARQGGRKKLDVTEMMTTWTSQMGFPVITVKRYSPRKVHTKQQRFLVHPDTRTDADDGYLWVVPLTYITQDQPELRHEAVLTKDHKEQEVDLWDEVSDDSWIKMNAGQTGFYRVNYELENWQKLINQLNTDHEVLTGADRAGLLDDALNLARSGMLPDDVALNLTPYLKYEREYVPLMSALNNLVYFATQFSTYDSANGTTDTYSTYKRYIMYLLRDTANELGWVEHPDEPHLKRYLRASVLHLVTEYEDILPDQSEAIQKNKSLELFNGWLNKNEPITPNLRNLVYSAGVKYKDEDTWNKVFDRFQSEPNAAEKRKLMYALANSRDTGILQRLLSYSLDDSKIRSQDSVAVINAVARNPAGRLLGWEFLKKNYDTLFERYGKGSFDFSRLIKATAAHFNTEEMKNKTIEFWDSKEKGSGELAVRQTVESIEANIKWINDHAEKVVTWLKGFLDLQNGHHAQATLYDEMEQYGRP